MLWCKGFLYICVFLNFKFQDSQMFEIMSLQICLINKKNFGARCISNTWLISIKLVNVKISISYSSHKLLLSPLVVCTHLHYSLFGTWYEKSFMIESSWTLIPVLHLRFSVIFTTCILYSFISDDLLISVCVLVMIFITGINYCNTEKFMNTIILQKLFCSEVRKCKFCGTNCPKLYLAYF